MKLEKSVAAKLIRDGIISLFLYALPIALMFLYFYIRGERPWKAQKRGQQITVNQQK
ncbi:hypothetical protein KTO58_13070 [Chitinophaga pendula]|uniref:hypothetical protein n=1 Tax=Chitinophaga TaxID=79328 RepID=UPI0018E02F2E|nr:MULTISPECIES: hypothetical protein [Chitinophaga]UCJ10086.1 hypothetical protein KTO58_13070 [Chitinophaga pendula]